MFRILLNPDPEPTTLLVLEIKLKSAVVKGLVSDPDLDLVPIPRVTHLVKSFGSPTEPDPDPHHWFFYLFFIVLKKYPHSDEFHSDIIRVRTYFAFGGRSIRTKIVRT
jgi:hypothetical protein